MKKEVYQKLAIDPRWLETQVDVPVYLEPDQNLFNQPPFARMINGERVFPHGVFQPGQEDKGKFFAVDILLRHYVPEFRTFSRENTGGNLTLKGRLERIAPLLTVSYEKREEVARDLCRRLMEFLKPYPYGWKYLKEHLVTEKDYALDGSKIDPLSKFRMRTYVAWEDAQIKANNDKLETRWVGLEEERPAGFSRRDDVVRAMPGGKSEQNKIYRLIHYSEALK